MFEENYIKFQQIKMKLYTTIADLETSMSFVITMSLFHLDTDPKKDQSNIDKQKNIIYSGLNKDQQNNIGGKKNAK